MWDLTTLTLKKFELYKDYWLLLIYFRLSIFTTCVYNRYTVRVCGYITGEFFLNQNTMITNLD